MESLGVTGALIAAVIILSKVVDFFLSKWKNSDPVKSQLEQDVKYILRIIGKTDEDGRPCVYVPSAVYEIQEKTMELMHEISLNLRDMSSIQKEILSTQKEILNITQIIRATNETKTKLDEILHRIERD